LQNYVPPGKVLVASTGLQNKMLYAAVAQVVDDESGRASSKESAFPRFTIRQTRIAAICGFLRDLFPAPPTSSLMGGKGVFVLEHE
jgi:hypothetical protein